MDICDLKLRPGLRRRYYAGERRHPDVAHKESFKGSEMFAGDGVCVEHYGAFQYVALRLPSVTLPLDFDASFTSNLCSRGAPDGDGTNPTV